VIIDRSIKILILLSFFIYVPYGFSGKDYEERPNIVPPEAVVAPSGTGHCMGVSKKKVAIFKAVKLACSKNVAFIGEGRSCFMVSTGRDTSIKRKVADQYCDVSYFDTHDELLRDPKVNRNSIDNVLRMKILAL
jgi:hypothetical protein